METESWSSLDESIGSYFHYGVMLSSFDIMTFLQPASHTIEQMTRSFVTQVRTNWPHDCDRKSQQDDLYVFLI